MTSHLTILAAALTMLPASGVAEFTMRGDISGPEGKRHYDQRVTVSASGPERYRFDPGAGANARRDPENEDSRRIASATASLDLLACLVRDLPPQTATEERHWSEGCNVPLREGDNVAVPLSVTARSHDAHTMVLSAGGRGVGALHVRGHELHADVSVEATATYRDGVLVTATTMRAVDLRLPFRSMRLAEKWTTTN